MTRVVQQEVTFQIPKTLLRKAEAILEARGSNLEAFIRLNLKSLVRCEKFYGLADVMNFGKFRGEVIEDIIRGEPRYVAWCLREVAGFVLTIEALSLLEDMEIDL